MEKQDYNWNSFQLRIPINADKRLIFDRCITQKGLESWFLKKASFKQSDGSNRHADDPVQKGDTYHWTWHGWPDEVFETGSILETGSFLLKFTFGPAGNVTIRVKEEEGVHILELVQDEIPTDDHSKAYYHLGCSKGWTFYMVNLKSILEGGPDLRNKNEALKNVVTA